MMDMEHASRVHNDPINPSYIKQKISWRATQELEIEHIERAIDLILH